VDRLKGELEVLGGAMRVDAIEGLGGHLESSEEIVLDPRRHW
jgi:hypothetical protein